MCLYLQAPDEAAESINLSQSVSVTTPEETVPEETVPEETEEEKNLPEWSEKVASGILTGEVTLDLAPKICFHFYCGMFKNRLSNLASLTGASWLKWGLVKGAEYTGVAIHKGASKLREHITPEDKPAQVSPTVTKSLHVAKQATGGAVKVSQFLGDTVSMFIMVQSFTLSLVIY